MGTHPIFESDFDCLTVSNWSAGNGCHHQVNHGRSGLCGLYYFIARWHDSRVAQSAREQDRPGAQYLSSFQRAKGSAQGPGNVPCGWWPNTGVSDEQQICNCSKEAAHGVCRIISWDLFTHHELMCIIIIYELATYFPLFVIFYLLIDSYQKIDILTILCNIKFYLQVPLFASSSMMIHHQHITVLYSCLITIFEF